MAGRKYELPEYAETLRIYGIQEGATVDGTARPAPDDDLATDSFDVAPQPQQRSRAEQNDPVVSRPPANVIGAEARRAPPQQPEEANAARGGTQDGLDREKSRNLEKDGFFPTGVEGRIRCKFCKKECDASRPVHKPTCIRPPNEENVLVHRPGLLPPVPGQNLIVESVGAVRAAGIQLPPNMGPQIPLSEGNARAIRAEGIQLSPNVGPLTSLSESNVGAVRAAGIQLPPNMGPQIPLSEGNARAFRAEGIQLSPNAGPLTSLSESNDFGTGQPSVNNDSATGLYLSAENQPGWSMQVPLDLNPFVCICRGRNVRVHLLPCGHYVCVECSPRHVPATCPICTENVQSAHLADPRARNY